MKTRLVCLLVAACATFVVPDLAYACGTGAVLFADDFKTPDARRQAFLRQTFLFPRPSLAEEDDGCAPKHFG